MNAPLIAFGSTLERSRVASNLKCGQLEQVIELYAGSFVPTLDLEIGIELQEWLYQCREELASRVPQML
jgi:hypothetical protein